MEETDMIQAKCIEKFRDRNGKIYGYRLVDLNNQTQDVTPRDLKIAIQNNHINVINLALTADGRLIDKKPENQLQFLETSSSLPANMEAWEDEALSNELITTFGEQLENSEHMPLLPEWEQIAQSFLTYWEQITVGGADVAEQMETFNEEATNILN